MIVSYFCVLGFVYIYSFLINEKVKSLFLNNPLSTSTCVNLVSQEVHLMPNLKLNVIFSPLTI